MHPGHRGDWRCRRTWSAGPLADTSRPAPPAPPSRRRAPRRRPCSARYGSGLWSGRRVFLGTTLWICMTMQDRVCSCPMAARMRIGIAGGSGYTGAELLRLCANHPNFEVVVATGDTQAGSKAADLYPSLAAAYPDLVYESYEPTRFDGLDLAFLALPHGASQDLVRDLRKRVGKVVDLAADFRLKDPALYPTWYHAEHTAPELLAAFAFGLPELFRAELR